MGKHNDNGKSLHQVFYRRGNVNIYRIRRRTVEDVAKVLVTLVHIGGELVILLKGLEGIETVRIHDVLHHVVAIPDHQVTALFDVVVELLRLVDAHELGLEVLLGALVHHESRTGL